VHTLHTWSNKWSISTQFMAPFCLLHRSKRRFQRTWQTGLRHTFASNIRRRLFLFVSFVLPLSTARRSPSSCRDVTNRRSSGRQQCQSDSKRAIRRCCRRCCSSLDRCVAQRGGHSWYRNEYYYCGHHPGYSSAVRERNMKKYWSFDTLYRSTLW